MATKTGTSASETINGTSAADTLWGRGGNDTLNGLASADKLYGETGNDTLRGGTGNDRLDGGSGLDTASYTDATGAVTLNTVLSSGNRGTDTLVSIENLTGGAYDDFLDGDDVANVLRGESGNDFIGGENGNDTLHGGEGDDQLWGYFGNDTLTGGLDDDTLTGEDGIDTASYADATGDVEARLDFGFSSGNRGADTLASIENLTGGAYNDLLVGNSGANVLRGGAGSDSLYGETGDDTLYGESGSDLLDGGDGNDRLEGGSGDDQLDGGDGNDTLYGGLGRDDLSGFAGVDTYLFKSIQDSAVDPSDAIWDFVRSEDKIDVSVIDAKTGATGNQAFTFIGEATGFTAPGQILYAQSVPPGSGGFTFVHLNNDADSAAESTIAMAGVIDLAASDFVL